MRALLTTFALLATVAGAETIELRPTDDWFGTLHGGGLAPGTEVVLRGGTYSDRRRLELNHRGAKARPVVIRAAEGENVVFERPDARQNSFNLVGCQHLVLRGFEITGGSAGIRISAGGGHQPLDITLEGLHIHHIGGAAVTCNHAGSYYANMYFRRNHIHHTGGHGEGFYLGCNNAGDGSTPGAIFDSFIEANHIHHLDGDNVSQGDGIEVKDGSYRNFIRGNVIHDTKYPGITVYGTDGKARNVIEGNRVRNTGDNGIQVAADAIVRNNIIADAGGDAIHVRQHQSAEPGNLKLVGNTLVQTSKGRTGLRVQRPAGGFTGEIVIANNAIYAARALRVPDDGKIRIDNNVGAGSSDRPLTDGEWAPVGELSRDLDEKFNPKPGSVLLEKNAGAREPEG